MMNEIRDLGENIMSLTEIEVCSPCTNNALLIEDGEFLKFLLHVRRVLYNLS